MPISLRTFAASSVVAVALLGTAPAATVLADPVGTSTVASAPHLASVDNFRDVAGPGYPVAGGKHVRRGVVYRSNALTPSATDAAALDRVGLVAVYDLRTTAEVTKTPDRVPAGARYVRINIMGDGPATAAATSMDLSTLTAAKGRALLEDANRGFVTDASQRARFAELLRDIAAARGPVVFHCTAGKDRTGWASALLLTIAGASPDDVMANYLLTNQYSARSIDAAARAAAAKGGDGAGIRAVMGVHREALQAGLDEATRRYGSLDGYLRSGLGLDGAVLTALRAKLTV